MNFCGLDIETESIVEDAPEYALQPWRVKTREAVITSVGIYRGLTKSGSCHRWSDDDDLVKYLKEPYKIGKDFYFVTFNGIFDIAFLHAAGAAVSAYRWIDVMLLWKWVANSQQKERIPRWSLVDAVKELLPHEPWAHDFIEMKQLEDQDRDAVYWEKRAKADAFVTTKLAEHLWAMLTDKQRKSALIEAQCLVPVAKSWVRGVRMNFDEVEKKRPMVEAGMVELEEKLGVARTVLRSPKQLCDLLYNDWGLQVNDEHRTPKGDPSSSKAALTYLADHDDRVLEILRWRELNTQLTKFLESPLKAKNYLKTDSGVMHPAPRLFSTYTGRMTYSSKIQKKYPIGMALHQWPRNKDLRSLIQPPEGHDIVEYDATGQEMRLMAEFSQDRNLLDIFQSQPPFDDAHSFTGAQLAGLSFKQFLQLKAEGNKQITGEHGYRYQGKFTNLSNQYRVGVRKLRIMSRVQYGMNITFQKALEFQKAYFRLYPGIKQYWRDAIRRGYEQGYAETLSGRRFYLTDWHSNEWGTQQSAINLPIQGSGGDMKELAIAVLTQQLPDLEFGFDLHDALFMYIRKDHPDKMQVIKEGQQILNDLPYKLAWGWHPSIPIPWDCKWGPSWGEMEEL